MNKTTLLLKTQIYNYFSLNELFHSEKKRSNFAFITAVGIFTLLALLSGYNIMTALALAKMGQAQLIPAYMVSVSNFIILVFTVLRSNGILFGCRDYEMLSSLPVQAKEIISSKFGFLYLLNFLLGILFMLPAGIIWQIYASAHLLFFFMYLASAVFVPFVPMCIASLLGVLVTAVSSKFRRKNIVSLVFSFAVLGGLLGIGIYSMQTGASGGSLGVILMEQVSRLYPLSAWFRYTNYFSLAGNVGFWSLSALVFCIFVKIVECRYARLNSYVLQYHAASPGRKANLKKHSVFTAVYLKEMGRYFSSYLWVLNTGLGVVLLCVTSLALCVVSPEILGMYAGIEDVDLFLGQYAPLIIAAMLSISCPAASAISLEGRNLWVLQSIPLSNKTFIKSKIALTLTVHAIGYMLSVAVFLIRFQFNAIWSFTLLAVPACYSVFTAVQGTYINCCFPRFDWDNEMVVVKQSISVILSGVIGMICIAVPVLLHWFLGLPNVGVLWGMAAILIVLSVILYFKACGKKII
jgi:ABC-2 type transport system permease protein